MKHPGRGIAPLLAIAFALAPGWCATPATVRISQSAAGAEGDQNSASPSISADGRFIAFTSRASNLVTLDVNTKDDVLVVDRQAKTIARVSVSSAGLESDGVSVAPSISGDGRYVAFESTATNLVPGKGQGIYVRDRQTNQTSYLGQGDSPVISADGAFVAFVSDFSLIAADTNLVADVYAADRSTGALELVSVASDGTVGDKNSGRAGIAISANGSVVAFQSTSLNLVPSATNTGGDVYVRDRTAGTTERVSLTFDGNQAEKGCAAPAIGADGNLVAFETTSTNMIASDTNDSYDVFVRDRAASTTTRVSLSSTGAELSMDSRDPQISPDGRYVSFETEDGTVVAGDGNNRLDIFVRSLADATTFRVSLTDANTDPGGPSYHTAMGADMRYVAFTSEAPNMITGVSAINNDIYVRGPLLDSQGLLVFATQPAGAAANAAFATQPVVEARNLDGALQWDFSDAVTLAIRAGSGRPGAVLGGNVTVSAVGGIATFAGLKIDLAGTGYVLAADSGAWTGESAAFDVAQVATNLAFSTQPGGASAGAVFTTQPVVQVLDAENNVALNYTGPVTMAIKPGTGQVGAILSGTTTVNATAGIATFSGLSIDRPAAGYVLVASSAPLVAGESASFAVARIPFTAADIATAMRWAGGLSAPLAAEAPTFDIVQAGASNGRIDLLDAQTIARKVGGLDPNP